MLVILLQVMEPIPYPSPVSDHKASGLMNSQRTTQSPSSLNQGICQQLAFVSIIMDGADGF
jgi:hypothetical protein